MKPRPLFLRLLLLPLLVSSASACSCLAPRSPEAAFQDAEVVLEAQFLGDRNDWGANPETAPAKVGIFQVIRSWRGEPPPRLEAPRGSPQSSCFRHLTPGERVVLSDRGGDYRVGLCTPFLDKVAEVEEAFGPGEPVAPEPADTPPEQSEQP